MQKFNSLDGLKTLKEKKSISDELKQKSDEKLKHIKKPLNKQHGT